MKRILMVFTGLLLCAGNVYGGEYPVDRGSAMFSGMFTFANYSGELYEDYDGNSTTMVTLAPSVLTFIVPNFALGGNMVFSRNSTGDDNITSVAFGPKFAFFVGKQDSKVYPFFGMGINYVTATASYVWYDWDDRRHKETDTATGTNFFFSAGVAMMVGRNLAVVFEGSFNHNNLEPGEGSSASGDILSLGVGLAGFVY